MFYFCSEVFPCNKWLAVDNDDGMIDRLLLPVGVKDLLRFDGLFSDNMRAKITDDHLWLSTAYRPQPSNFTRVQRLSCCYVILFLAMIANAMFFGQGDTAANTQGLVLGPIKITLGMLWISFISILITTPAAVIVVLLFKQAKPKEPNIGRRLGTENQHSKMLPEEDEKEDTKGNGCCGISAEEKQLMNQLIIVDEYEDQRFWPHWVAYMAYVLAFLAVAASGFFLILYSMQWGKAKSEEWLTAFFLSTFQSFLIIDPIKVRKVK